MAETLHLSSGEIEVIFNENNKEKILGNIIRENLGRDCDELFYLLFEDARNEQSCGDDYEVIADGYRGMLLDTVEELDGILLLFRSKRLNRTDLQKRLQNCRDNIYNNI